MYKNALLLPGITLELRCTTSRKGHGHNAALANVIEPTTPLGAISVINK